MQLIWRTSGIFEVRARTTASLCFARILALQALSAFAAKTSRRLSLEATEPSDGSEREFTVFDKKTCVGDPLHEEPEGNLASDGRGSLQRSAN